MDEASAARSHCRYGLLHGPNRYIQAALLLLRHQPRSQAHPFHFNVTDHPTSAWVIQQLREAFPFQCSSRFLLFDRDSKFSFEVTAAVRSLGLRPVRTSFASPWQNGVAERWIESCRRELLDCVIAFNEAHLKRLLSDYLRYYHDDRTHLGLAKQTPANRIHSGSVGRVLSFPRLGGLHHRYERAA
jgi:putative transposase